MRLFIQTICLVLCVNQTAFADEASDWLKTEIDFILGAYNNSGTSNESRFLMIENTINYNFAGSGIAKFVAGKAWAGADKNTKKEYITSFKRHLALNISSMMQGYSNQEYKLINTKYDSKNKVSLINMEIYNDTGSLVVTWRVKKSKDRYFVIDLLVADISLVVTKRSEFNSMLKTVDYDLHEFNNLLKDQNESSYNKIIK
ncbi:ABC transporter substrate-binding protein [Alphaproteobacteria bacterium]|nr:ABC transporter substrate-binding protein [Alphaproteobacteria bacterium]